VVGWDDDCLVELCCWCVQVYVGMRTIRIDNTGAVVSMTISPALPSPYVMDNFNPSTVTVTYVSGPAITSVTFYKQMSTSSSLIGEGQSGVRAPVRSSAVAGGGVWQLCMLTCGNYGAAGTVSAAPWTTSITAYEVPVGGTLTIQALVFSSTGVCESTALGHSDGTQSVSVHVCMPPTLHNGVGMVFVCGGRCAKCHHPGVRSSEGCQQ
jgi:hypothetical protein